MGDVVAYLASQHQAMMPDAPWRHTGVTLEDFHAAVKKKSGPPKRIHVSKHGDPGSGGGSSAAAAGGGGRKWSWIKQCQHEAELVRFIVVHSGWIQYW